MKIMTLSASLSRQSINRDLIHLTEKKLVNMGIRYNHFDFKQLTHTAYCRDLQNEKGIPSDIIDFGKQLDECDALIIASPEYNGSIPGHLKNLLDWASRMRPSPWSSKPVLLMSASPSLMGGIRGLLGTRVPFESCRAFVFPQVFSLPAAYDAFNEDGELINSEHNKKLDDILEKFLMYTKGLTNQ